MSLASFQSTVVRLTPIVSNLVCSNAPKAITPIINKQLKRHYSISQYRRAPIRRRKGGATPPESTLFHDPNEEEEASSRSPQSITSDPQEFSNRANELLERVYTAVLPMKKFNDVFDIHLPPKDDTVDRQLTIHLDPRFGSFYLSIDHDNMTVQLTSPISGYLEYTPSVNGGEWVNTEDSHDLIGIIVRDLIRSCNGLPKF